MSTGKVQFDDVLQTDIRLRQQDGGAVRVDDSEAALLRRLRRFREVFGRLKHIIYKVGAKGGCRCPSTSWSESEGL